MSISESSHETPIPTPGADTASEEQGSVSTNAAPSEPVEEEKPSVGSTALLVGGDLLVFLIFAIIGITSHKVPFTPLEILKAGGPFALGWFIIAPFLRAYSLPLRTQIKAMAWSTFVAWLAALPIGVLIRGITIDHGAPPLTFIIVTFISNALFLLIWRVPFAFITNRLTRKA